MRGRRRPQRDVVDVQGHELAVDAKVNRVADIDVRAANLDAIFELGKLARGEVNLIRARRPIVVITGAGDEGARRGGQLLRGRFFVGEVRRGGRPHDRRGSGDRRVRPAVVRVPQAAGKVQPRPTSRLVDLDADADVRIRRQGRVGIFGGDPGGGCLGPVVIPKARVGLGK